MKDKNHSIISTDEEKSPQQNSTSFHDKSSEVTKNRKNIPQYYKGYTCTEWGKTETTSSKIRKRQACPLSPLLIKYHCNS
jgi:hypothetical protein